MREHLCLPLFWPASFSTSNSEKPASRADIIASLQTYFFADVGRILRCQSLKYAPQVCVLLTNDIGTSLKK
jgi:hypothetical protein